MKKAMIKNTDVDIHMKKASYYTFKSTAIYEIPVK